MLFLQFSLIMLLLFVAVGCCCCSIATSVSEVFQESAADHLLLFVCALIPKAMASLLTSAILELSKPGNVRKYKYKMFITRKT